jgi:type VII secretion protein EccB
VHSRRDQVQAHTFLVGRLVSALLQGEPDLAVPPTRRTPLGLVIGSLLAAVAVGGLALLAVLAPGGATGWRKPGTLIVEKQTGTRLVLLDGRLRPVLNYASGRLLLGSKLTVDSVPAASLAGVPRGAAVGILGAPDSLPDPGRPGGGPWLVCGTSTADSSTAGRQPAVALRIGAAADTRPVPDRQAVLVRTPDGTRYLAWRDRRLRLAAPWVERALGLDDGAAVAVRDGWIDALPAGPDLGASPVPGRGRPGPVLDGRPSRVGQVFVVHGTGIASRFYQLSAGGLVPATATAAALTLGDPAAAESYRGQPPQPLELSPAALGSATVLPAPAWQAQAPPAPPSLVPGGLGSATVPCVEAVPGTDRPAVSVVTAPADAAGESTVDGPALVRDARTADLIAVRPGGGLLARTQPVPGVPGDGLYLVTEDGAKYPVASADAADALGQPVSSAVAVPADLLALLPTGPVLDRIGNGGGAAGT